MPPKTTTRDKRPRGRPPLPDEDKGRPRTIRLNDERWERLRQLGREWLERAIDAADDGPRDS